MNWQQIIKDTKAFNSSWIDRNTDFLQREDIAKLGENYARSLEKSKVDIGFNLFTLISNIYHQENFHSDILKVFLQNNLHNEGNKYLHLFLEYLNILGAKINLSNYLDTLVFREKGKIDLLIYDRSSNHELIVENKINNATDQDRQIPRYVKYVVGEQKLECDCIVYMTLNRGKQPSIINWSEEEIRFIDSKMIYVLAYNNSDKDLYNGWISKAEKITTNIDALLVLRQYGALIKKLGGNIMNKVIVEEFYKVILEPENYKTAQSIKSMLGDLILFRAERLIDIFKNHLNPFTRIFIWQYRIVAMQDYFVDNHNWLIDIGVYEDEYLFEFWDKQASDTTEARGLLQKMNLLDDTFYENGGRMKRSFSFPTQEDELIDYVESFKLKLIEAIK